MRATILTIMIHVALASCATVLDLPPEVTPEHHVGGQVRGLWGGAGAKGLALQLQTVKGSLACTASENGIIENGSFECEDMLPVGTLYVVKIEDNPSLHTCVIDAGRSGMIADADIKDVSI